MGGGPLCLASHRTKPTPKNNLSVCKGVKIRQHSTTKLNFKVICSGLKAPRKTWSFHAVPHNTTMSLWGRVGHATGNTVVLRYKLCSTKCLACFRWSVHQGQSNPARRRAGSSDLGRGNFGKYICSMVHLISTTYIMLIAVN